MSLVLKGCDGRAAPTEHPCKMVEAQVRGGDPASHLGPARTDGLESAATLDAPARAPAGAHVLRANRVLQ
jgi:hypothetical protein